MMFYNLSASLSAEYMWYYMNDRVKKCSWVAIHEHLIEYCKTIESACNTALENNFLLKTSRAFKTSDVAEIFIAFWESYESVQ